MFPFLFFHYNKIKDSALNKSEKLKQKSKQRKISSRQVTPVSRLNKSKKVESNNIFSSIFKGKRKYILILIVGIILLFLWWYLTSFAPNIKIYAEVQDKKIEKQIDINAKFNLSDGGIQAFTKTETEAGSDSIPTTGTGNTGTKATGTVRATYLQASGDVTIKAGTIFTCINIEDCGGKPLNFLSTADVTFSLSTSPATINLEASNIGTDYNLKAGTKFRVTGIADSDISVTNIAPFTNGDSKVAKTVAQKDYDDLQSKLTDTIKSAAYQKIQSSTGSNSELLPDQVKIDIKSINTDKKVGDEGDTLNMNMELTVTVKGYDKSTVRPYIESVLKKEEVNNLKLDLNTLDLKQTVKSSDDSSIEIVIDASGILKPQIDKTETIKNLLGKSLSDIKPSLESISGVQNISYVYTPNWSPDFLKRVPGNTANVNLELKEVQ